ncbi:hypothetical protein GCK72_019137 [Caenorhabditis remanei]|uniref:Uncharacterized protein n=1 Tax=Caenorhabditis remanei TaxID=31234 RepID=A0A6A5GDN5_CAERE|nr:hypothetical protein GCK72_019137 [Caenorhabditis remanei]KAF1752582.1 hypothetical protein GCK72_019137 [Caenorhabditis remanei]
MASSLAKVFNILKESGIDLYIEKFNEKMIGIAKERHLLLAVPFSKIRKDPDLDHTLKSVADVLTSTIMKLLMPDSGISAQKVSSFYFREPIPTAQRPILFSCKVRSKNQPTYHIQTTIRQDNLDSTQPSLLAASHNHFHLSDHLLPRHRCIASCRQSNIASDRDNVEQQQLLPLSPSFTGAVERSEISSRREIVLNRSAAIDIQQVLPYVDLESSSDDGEEVDPFEREQYLALFGTIEQGSRAEVAREEASTRDCRQTAELGSSTSTTLVLRRMSIDAPISSNPRETKCPSSSRQQPRKREVTASIVEVAQPKKFKPIEKISYNFSLINLYSRSSSDTTILKDNLKKVGITSVKIMETVKLPICQENRHLVFFSVLGKNDAKQLSYLVHSSDWKSLFTGIEKKKASPFFWYDVDVRGVIEAILIAKYRFITKTGIGKTYSEEKQTHDALRLAVADPTAMAQTRQVF